VKLRNLLLPSLRSAGSANKPSHLHRLRFGSVCLECAGRNGLLEAGIGMTVSDDWLEHFEKRAGEIQQRVDWLLEQMKQVPQEKQKGEAWDQFNACFLELTEEMEGLSRQYAAAQRETGGRA
jgi:hypothetical protein